MTDIEKFLTATIEDLKKEREARDEQEIQDIIDFVFEGE